MGNGDREALHRIDRNVDAHLLEQRGRNSCRGQYIPICSFSKPARVRDAAMSASLLDAGDGRIEAKLLRAPARLARLRVNGSSRRGFIARQARRA